MEISTQISLSLEPSKPDFCLLLGSGAGTPTHVVAMELTFGLSINLNSRISLRVY
jgi:hypothetical protein